MSDKVREITMEPVYQPHRVEEHWYGIWQEKKYFHSNVSNDKKPFCIVIPPPNITGSLHMGHALDNTIQDLLIRWKRMQGYNAMWLPGTDHAGIATQMVVEKSLAKEGRSRHKLGREEFLKRVWYWKDEYGGIIVDQLKKLGCSCDWERERFTMDEKYSASVKKAFVHLFNKGYIYRDYYIINWCPRCQTAISDLEVEHEEDPKGKLYYVSYPFEGEEPDSGKGVVIATTRPETILADVAIAVHPDDERYKDIIGKKVSVPISGRLIPVIADEVVDPAFGTGALKITPGHDLNDFAVGKRHNLSPFVVIDQWGKMNAESEKFSHGKIPQGTDRFLARGMMERLMNEGGFLVKVPEQYNLPLARCGRCNTVLEPSYSLQWFMRMQDLAVPAIQVVRDDKVKFVPERFKANYLNWMENIRDWCLSRQLWWGHRIPAWYCIDCNKEYLQHDAQGKILFVAGAEVIVSETTPSHCPRCQSKNLVQDEDVLDTWFSSALWPFATMYWPKITDDLKYYYPTSVLVTGRDILYQWVARMIMMGLEFMGDIPFSCVYIHATILDKDGRRMSKSKGTGVDPLVLIQQYGSDATRFGVLFQTAQGQDVRFSNEKIEMARNFGNKIWNASRLIFKYVDREPPKPDIPFGEWLLPDRWIRIRVCEVIRDYNEYLNQYAFSDASRLLYDFFWSEFCDWYLEIAKHVFFGNDEKRKQVTGWLLWNILSNFLKLLHPMMPFITEEIWHFMDGDTGTIMTASWPLSESFKISDGLNTAKVKEQMQFIMDVVGEIRNMRAELNIPPKQEVAIYYSCLESDNASWQSSLLKAFKPEIDALTKVSISSGYEKKALSGRVGDITLCLPLEGAVNVELEVERLKAEINQLETFLEALAKKLTPEFLAKAKPEVVAREEKRKEEFLAKRELLLERLKLFQ